MAYKLNFAYPTGGMPFIWNVSQHVGCRSENPNQATDVELVQFFLRETIKVRDLGAKAASGAFTPSFELDGKYTSALGFWIFYSQLGGAAAATIDGIVSPAKGTSYGTGAWAIAKMNYHYKKIFPNEWANLANDMRLSAALRAQLAKSTP